MAVKDSVTIVGAGSQGRRLAYMWSSKGSPVALVDSISNQLSDSVAFVENLRKEVKSAHWGLITIHSPEDLSEVLQRSWLAIECVSERLPLKRKIIADIDRCAPDDLIIATNSSSYTGSEILDGMELRKAHRVLNAHTYWPPETSVLEIMGHINTDTRHVETMMTQSKAHGFTPVHVKGESIGYMYNRIWAAIKREALLVAAEGVGTPEEIDHVFREVLKTPKGPFEQMDTVGLDVVRDIEEHYAEARHDIPLEPRRYLQGYIEGGRLGVKTGRGFYEYN